MGKHIRTQQHAKSFGQLLKENNIPFEKEDADWMNTFNTNVGTVYRYEGDGKRRVVYEVSLVFPPDDYIMVSAMFNGSDGEPTKKEIREALNKVNDPA